MSDAGTSRRVSARLGEIRTRQDFAQYLTLLREQAGVTIRHIANQIGDRSSHSTIGDWFAGRGLPSLASRDVLIRVLRVCGVEDADEIEEWLLAWQRVRRSPGPVAGGPQPYRGLVSYQPEDAGWYFGRETPVERLVGLISESRAAGGGVQIVVGPSGSGKSSLLRAGLIPALGPGAVLCTPGAHPVDVLVVRLAEVAGAPVDEVADALRSEPARFVPPGLVLVVDQFEELFTACAEEGERRQFVDAVHAVATVGGAVVVLGLRADFYGQALRYRQLVDAVQTRQLALGPMNGTELRRAIVEPARKAKADIEDGLVELLLHEVSPRGGDGGAAHDPGVLPLLSHALYATWNRGDGRRITITDYRDAGGISGAVAATATAVHDALTDRQRTLARRLFLSLVHIAEDTADTRRRVRAEDLFLLAQGDDEKEDLAEVLDRFVAQRLLTAHRDTVEISHEALLTAWPLLRGWLDTDRAGLVIGRQLAEAAATWHRENRDAAALYRGTRLAVAREWFETAGQFAGPDRYTREFLDASTNRELDEQRAGRRRIRTLRQLIAGLAVLLLATVVATTVAVRSLGDIRDQRNAAISGKVANESTVLRASNPSLAAQLGLAAYRLAPTAEARGTVLSTFAATYSTRLTGHSGAVYAAVFTKDGRTLATVGTDHSVKLWDLADPRRVDPVATLDGHTAAVLGAAFAPGSGLLATAGSDRGIRLWDITRPRGRLVRVLAGHTGDIRRVAFRRDGLVLASTGMDGTIRLWDTAETGAAAALATITSHAGEVTAAVFSPDGRTLATTGVDNPVRLWDVSDPRAPTLITELTGHIDRVLCAEFSPDGRTLATGSFDNTLRLWDVSDPRRPAAVAALTGHKSGVASVAFGPDSKTLATGSYDSTVRLWDIEDPTFAGAPVTLAGHSDTVYSVAFSPDGRTVASSGRDTTTRLWDVTGPVLGGHTGPAHAAVPSPDGHLLVVTSYRTARLWNITNRRHPVAVATLTGHTDNILSAAFAKNGRLLATASLDRTVRLWNVADPSRPVLLNTLTAAAGNLFGVALSPDGTTLAAGDLTSVQLWDVTDPGHPGGPATVAGHTDRVFAVAFSPDGRTLASGGADRTARLWDVTDPRHPAPLATINEHTDTVSDVVFGPDGRTLATTSADRTAKLWDVSDRIRPTRVATVEGHNNGLSSAAFSPDGRTLATAAYDSTARLWDVGDPRRPVLVAPLTGHTDRVRSVEFSRDGRAVITAGADATARLWETGADEVAALICAHARPGITTADWDRHFTGLPFRPPCP